MIKHPLVFKILAIFTGIIYLYSCKRTDYAKPTVLKTQAAFIKVGNSLSADSNQSFTAITWGTAKSQPSGTHELHGEAVNGKLYIFGGYDINKRPGWSPTKHAYVYDPSLNAWASIADLPQTPNGPGFGGITHVGLTNDGTDIYFAGGYTSNADGTGQLFGTRQVWKYTVASNSYSRLPNLPKALAAGQMRFLNGKLHFMGGADSLRNDVGLHYALDLSNLSAGWKPLAPLINAVNHPGSAVFGGRIYFMGGAHHQNASSVSQNTLEVYDDQTNKWTQLANMPVAVDHISSAVIVTGSRIIYLGGETSHNVLSSGVFAYTPSSNTWQQLTSLPEGKSAGVAASLSGYIYYTGGNFSVTNYQGLPVMSDTVSLLPLADAYVRNGSFSSVNYGTDTVLTLKGAASNYTRYCYIKFSLSGLSTISAARLRLYGHNVDNTSTIAVSCYGVNDNSWAENGISFSNAPAASTSILSTTGINAQRDYYEFDVTSFANSRFAADKIVSLLLKDPADKNSTIVFNSRESVINKPQLIVYR